MYAGWYMNIYVCFMYIKAYVRKTENNPLKRIYDRFTHTYKKET